MGSMRDKILRRGAACAGWLPRGTSMPSARVSRSAGGSRAVAATVLTATLLATSAGRAASVDIRETYSAGLHVNALSVRHTDADGNTTGATAASQYAGYLDAGALTIR